MTITLRHQDDPTLEVTLSAPSEEAWAAWFDETPSSAYTAKYNLLAACRVAPSEAELTAIARDWPGLPEAAHPHLFMLGGAIILADAGKAPDPERSENAEVIDLRAMVELEPNGSDVSNAHARALAAFVAEGVTVETIRDWIARYPRPKQLFCVRTAQGFFVFHRPDTRAIIARETKAKSGKLHEAMKGLLYASLVHPAPAAFTAFCKSSPAAVTVLGTIVSEMKGASAAVVVKK